MALRTGDELKNMIFVYRGQPFVRASAILSGSADTQSLDYSYTATPFTIPSVFDEAVTPVSAKAIDPGLEYFITSISSSVVSARAPDLFRVANYSPFTVDTTSMSYSWLGRPYVKIPSRREIDTTSLDYVLAAEPFVAPAQPDVMSVAKATAPGLQVSRGIVLPSTDVAQATTVDPLLAIYTPFIANLGSMSYSWLGQPFVLTASVGTNTPSLDYAHRAAPLVVQAPAAPTTLSITIPASTVTSASAAAPQLLPSISLPASTVASATAHDLSLEGSVFISPTTSYAFAYDPINVHNIDIPPSNIVQSTAHDPALLGSIFITSSLARATAHTPQLQPNLILGTTSSFAYAIAPTVNTQTIALNVASAVATAIAPTIAPIQTIIIGLDVVVSSSLFGDVINRGEPFEPWATTGDLVNRGEPFSTNYKIEVKYLGVATATAQDPTIEIAIAPPEEVVRLPRIGQSGTKRAEREREREESIVWAKLIRVNDKTPEEKIEGFTRVHRGVATNFRVIAEGSPTTRVRKAWEDIKIAVARVK